MKVTTRRVNSCKYFNIDIPINTKMLRRKRNVKRIYVNLFAVYIIFLTFFIVFLVIEKIFEKNN